MSSGNTSSGIGLGTLATFATIVLAVLKLAGVIDWSWWLVFAPMIIVTALALLILAIVFLSLLVAFLVKSREGSQ